MKPQSLYQTLLPTLGTSTICFKIYAIICVTEQHTGQKQICKYDFDFALKISQLKLSVRMETSEVGRAFKVAKEAACDSSTSVMMAIHGNTVLYNPVH